MYRFKKGSGFPVSVPSVDLVEIGAGGGSLARVDQFGLLKVGPESSGADPGPASYGRGGTEPAVTDADVVLGLLDPAGFLGGDMPLDASLAAHAVGGVADKLALDLVATASGVHEVVNQNMSAAARMHAVEQGVDLRGVPMLAFGGAGPVHACGVAELLESSRVVFPVNASVLVGVRHARLAGAHRPRPLDGARPRPASTRPSATQCSSELRAEGRRVLLAAGVPADAVRFRYGADVRYAGQGNEVTVWLPTDEADIDAWPATAGELREAFESEYRRIYGLTIPDVGLQVVTWRLSAVSAAAEFEPTPVRRRQRRHARRSPTGRVRARPARPRRRRLQARRRSAPATRSTARRSSRSARRRSSSAPAGTSKSPSDGSLIATRSAGSAT